MKFRQKDNVPRWQLRDATKSNRKRKIYQICMCTSKHNNNKVVELTKELKTHSTNTLIKESKYSYAS